MTGRRNRAQAATKFGKRCLPNWFLPPAPPPIFPAGNFPKGKSLFDAISRQIFLPSGFIMDQKNWTAKSFSFSEQPQNSVRTSLVPLSICLWEVRACVGRRGCQGVVNAAASTGRRKRCGVAPPPTGLREFFVYSQTK